MKITIVLIIQINQRRSAEFEIIWAKSLYRPRALTGVQISADCTKRFTLSFRILRTVHCALEFNAIHSGKVHWILHCSVDGWVEGGNYCRVQFRRQRQFTRLLTIYFLLLLLQRHSYSNVFFCTHTAIQPFCVYLIPPNSPSCIYCQYSIVYCNTSILLIHIHFKHDTKWWSCTVCMVSTLKCSIYSWADVYTLYCNIIGADMTSVVSNEQYIILKSSRVDVHNVAST